mgnify:FL=1
MKQKAVVLDNNSFIIDLYLYIVVKLALFNIITYNRGMTRLFLAVFGMFKNSLHEATQYDPVNSTQQQYSD